MESPGLLVTNSNKGDRRNKMIEVGRICIKTAGRDADLKCVIVDILDKNYVLIDGETRRRKCNIMHLEPLQETIEIKKEASHEEVKKEFEKLGLKIKETKAKEKKEKPKKVRRKKKVKEEKTGKEKKHGKKKVKKEEKSGLVKEKTEQNKEKKKKLKK